MRHRELGRRVSAGGTPEDTVRGSRHALVRLVPGKDERRYPGVVVLGRGEDARRSSADRRTNGLDGVSLMADLGDLVLVVILLLMVINGTFSGVN